MSISKTHGLMFKRHIIILADFYEFENGKWIGLYPKIHLQTISIYDISNKTKRSFTGTEVNMSLRCSDLITSMLQ